MHKMFHDAEIPDYPSLFHSMLKLTYRVRQNSSPQIFFAFFHKQLGILLRDFNT